MGAIVGSVEAHLPPCVVTTQVQVHVRAKIASWSSGDIHRSTLYPSFGNNKKYNFDNKQYRYGIHG